MSKPVVWLRGAKGLNNRVDPLRLEFDPDTGLQDLAVAVNVDIDHTGRISRRRGWEATDITDPCHSLFAHGTTALFVTGTNLCVLGTDFSYAAIRTVTAGARMSYAVLNDRIFYGNGFETGYVRAGVSYAWSMPSSVPGVRSLKEYSDPPVGHLLAYYKGRMYVVQGDIVWYSESFGINLFNRARNYLAFDSHLRMFHPVRRGIWMGTHFETYFLEGDTPKNFTLHRVATYPPIFGTDVDIDSSRVGRGEYKGIGVIWTSSEGICLGTSEGEFINLTERRLTYPNALEGTGIYNGFKYISVLEP